MCPNSGSTIRNYVVGAVWRVQLTSLDGRSTMCGLSFTIPFRPVCEGPESPKILEIVKSRNLENSSEIGESIHSFTRKCSDAKKFIEPRPEFPIVIYVVLIY